MPRTVTCQIIDEPDGRFSVVAVMAPDRVYRRDDLATLAEAEDWIEGLRGLMAACGAPVALVRGGLEDRVPAGQGAGSRAHPPGPKPPRGEPRPPQRSVHK